MVGRTSKDDGIARAAWFGAWPTATIVIATCSYGHEPTRGAAMAPGSENLAAAGSREDRPWPRGGCLRGRPASDRVGAAKLLANALEALTRGLTISGERVPRADRDGTPRRQSAMICLPLTQIRRQAAPSRTCPKPLLPHQSFDAMQTVFRRAILTP